MSAIYGPVRVLCVLRCDMRAELAGSPVPSIPRQKQIHQHQKPGVIFGAGEQAGSHPQIGTQQIPAPEVPE